MVSAISARASGGSVTVRGGGKLRKFVTNFRNLSNEVVAMHMARILRAVCAARAQGARARQHWLFAPFDKDSPARPSGRVARQFLRAVCFDTRAVRIKCCDTGDANN